MPQRSELEPFPSNAGTPRGPRFDPRLALALLLLGSAFGMSGYLVWSEAQAHASSTSSETRVLGRALGRELQTQGDVAALANKLARSYLRQPITLRVGKRAYPVARAALGVSVDLPAFTELLRAASDARSPLRRLHAQQRGDDALDLPLPAHLMGDRAERFVRALAASHDEPVRPARVDFQTGQVLAATAGKMIDVQATLDALSDAVFDGSLIVPVALRALEPAAPPALDGLDVSRVLGSFESAQGDTDSASMFDLAAAAAQLDGLLLTPGAELDVAAALGELHAGRAFHPAGVSLLDGDRVEAAVSLVASTLYAAALFSGLPILEQHARARPSTAIEVGFDAAITSQHNLRFRNDLDHTLAVAVSVKDGRVRASLRGPVGHRREVDIERAIEEIAPYVEITRADPSLPSGALVVVQRGRPGLRVTLTRNVRESEDDNSQREQRSAVYPPSPRIVRVGHGSGTHVGAVAQAPALHAEYVVDEFVGYGMRPGFELPQESERRAGRTGVEGWTTQHGP